jgi:hypothetical protein
VVDGIVVRNEDMIDEAWGGETWMGEASLREI